MHRAERCGVLTEVCGGMLEKEYAGANQAAMGQPR